MEILCVGLPEGITIAEHTGAISGTPTVVNNQPSVATITVTDAIGQTASIEINVGRVFENYEFNVAGTLVTGINKDDIPVTGKTSGTISYDPETETLIFNNVVINNRNAATSYFVDSKISKINVVGDNSITYVNNASGASQYLGFPSDLEIYGDGTFGFSFGPNRSTPYAVKGNVTVMEDATIQLSSSYTAINGTILSQMPEKQRNLFLAISSEGQASSISGGQFVRKYRLISPSSVLSAAKGLLDKDFITGLHHSRQRNL